MYNQFKDTVFKEGGNHWSEIEKNVDRRGPNGICVLEPIPDAKPKADKPIRAVGLREEATCEKIKELQRKGCTVPSQSHWVSRGLLVPKPGTKKSRLVIDYGYVNTQLRGCKLPLPVIEDWFVKQAGKQLLTLLDLEDVFHQMPLSELSRQYTAFCIPFGVFVWGVPPTGAKVGPQAYQRMVSGCFKSLQPHKHIYINDLLTGTRPKLCSKGKIIDSKAYLGDHFQNVVKSFEKLEECHLKESDQHLNNYRPGGGGSGGHGKGYQGSRPGQGTTPKHAHACIMENVKKLFWCDARDEQGHLQHAPDCEQRDCFLVQGKQQEKNTGAKAKLPDHYRCTITCAFCGKRKHYEDECYHKQRLSAKLKGEDPGKGSGKGGGKGKGNDSGKGKSKGRGQGQDKGQGGRGGGANRQPDNKNEGENGGNPNPNPGGNSEPSGGQSGPTTRSQTQAQQEQGAKREHEGGDDGNAKKRSRFMRMARKLRNKGFEVTCPAEF